MGYELGTLKIGKKKPTGTGWFQESKLLELFLMTRFIRNCKFLSSFSPSEIYYLPATGRTHSFSEAMFVSTLPVRWLKCSFRHILFLFLFSLFSGCKNSEYL